MTTPSARFAIGFDADTSGINQSRSALDSLKSSIEKDTKALTEMKAAMDRLRGTAEVARFEALPKDIRAAENEMAKLAKQMEALKAQKDAAKSTLTDMKMGKIEFDPKIYGKASDAFSKSADKLDLVTEAYDKQKNRLAALKTEQEKLAKSEPVKLFQDLKLGSDKLKESLGKNQTAFSRLGGTMGETKDAASKMQQLGEAAKQVPGPVGETASKLEQIAKMGKAGAIVAIAVALTAVAVGFAAAVVKATAFAVAMADAARSAMLLREANAVGSASAADLKNATLAVLDKTNAQEEAVAGLVAEYSRLRFSIAAIEDATSAITIVTQTAGQAAGATIKGLIDRAVDTKRAWLGVFDLKGTGLAFNDVASAIAKNTKTSLGIASAALRDGRVKVEDFTKALNDAAESRFGEVARRQMLALPTQIERLKKNLSTLFSGVKIEGFLEKLNDALSLFKETEVVGKALKQVFSVVLQPFINSATEGMPLVEGFIYGVVIALQALTIVGLKTAIAIKRIWGQSDTLKNVDMLKAGIYAGAAAVSVFAGIMATLAVITITVGAAMLVVVAAIALIAAPIFLIGYAIGWMIDTVSTTIDDLVTYMNDTGTTIGDAVKGILKAIVDSVTGGITDVANAFKDLAMAGVKAFKDAIQMKSPPRVFVRIGEAIPDAVAGGVDKGQPAVARSLSEMVDPNDMVPQGAPVGNASQSAKQGESAASYVLNYYGNGSRSDAQQFAQWFHNELELAALAEGLPA